MLPSNKGGETYLDYTALKYVEPHAVLANLLPAIIQFAVRPHENKMDSRSSNICAATRSVLAILRKQERACIIYKSINKVHNGAAARVN